MLVMGPLVVGPGALGAIEGNSVPALDNLLKLGTELTVRLHVFQHYFGVD